MQNDLISRDVAIDALLRQPDPPTPSVIRRVLRQVPAADAVEVDKAMAWLEGYTMTDTKQIYSNGIVYVPMFRVEQAFVDKAYNGLWED